VSDPVSTGSYFKIKTTGAEAAALTVKVYGFGADGNHASETVAIPTASGGTTTGSTLFTRITEVIVSVTAHDTIAYLNNSTDTFFARYEAGETMPNYRRYRLAFGTADSTLNAICKRRFYLLSADNDPVDICNVIGIECALRAYRYMQASDLRTYRDHIIEAVGYLNGELARHQSETESVTVQFEPALMMGRVENIP
jgi:hypothetical protein